jgi:acyl-CoA synthetase (AMP-forming)/AMP-acid ligase II
MPMRRWDWRPTVLVSDIPVIAADRAPQERAIIFRDRVVTYAQLRDRCWRLSNALSRVAAPGDRIAILAENCPEYVDCYYGVPGAGMALTLLNYRLAPRELAYIIGNSAPRVLIVEPKYLSAIRQIRAELPSVERVLVIGENAEDSESYNDFLASGQAAAPLRRPAEDDLCWLLYTSGTTGLPKGAMLTHRNLMAGVCNSLIAWELSPDELCMFTFPLFHVAGYSILMFHMRTFPVVLMRGFDPASFLENAQAHRVTNTGLAPTMVSMLLNDPATERYNLSSLRRIAYGAAAMPVEILRKARARWPSVSFNTGFGMTELAGNVMALYGQDHVRAAQQGLDILRSVGRQMPLARVRVVDDTGTDAQPGQPGEIVVKGDQVLSGYWRNPEATAEAFTDGWFHTGDVGRWDDEGYLYVIDRKKDMILTGGENVYSREVEEVLFTHPAVIEAAVVGAPDVHWGEKVVAVVSRRSDCRVDAAELIDFCRGQIAGYKRPRHVVFVDTLPKSASGKVLKRELRALIEAGSLKLE